MYSKLSHYNEEMKHLVNLFDDFEWPWTMCGKKWAYKYWKVYLRHLSHSEQL